MATASTETPLEAEPREAQKLTWSASATGDRFPECPGSSHPVWRHFLDSGSLSPTQFFRAFLAPPNYFHSPQPWRGRGRLSDRVSELLDSFRPGSYSYRPFKKDRKRNVEESIRQRAGLAHDSEDGREGLHSVETRAEEVTLRPEQAPGEREALEDADDDDRISEEQHRQRRQRLYVDIGRPRPFYRRSGTSLASGGQHQNQRIKSIPDNNGDAQVLTRSLQDLARFCLVHHFGLKQLGSILNSSSTRLPPVVKDQALTFLCRDFEEVQEEPFSNLPPSPRLSRRTASYRVRSVIPQDSPDSRRIYLAVFATSEVDKNVCNLWDEYRQWLALSSFCGGLVLPILALVSDPLTENIFFLVEEFEETLEDYIERRGRRVHQVLNAALEHADDDEEDRECVNLAKEIIGYPNILVMAKEATQLQILLQNPLLFPKFRCRLQALDRASERRFLGHFPVFLHRVLHKLHSLLGQQL